jgi:hypothetical protein
VSGGMSATGGDGTRLRARGDKSSQNVWSLHAHQRPHIRGERHDHAPDVQPRIAPPAVALVAPLDASQHGVVLVVGRDPRGRT